MKMLSLKIRGLKNNVVRIAKDVEKSKIDPLEVMKITLEIIEILEIILDRIESLENRIGE